MTGHRIGSMGGSMDGQVTQLTLESPKVEVGEPDWVHGCATGLGGMSVRLVHVWSVSRS